MTNSTAQQDARRPGEDEFMLEPVPRGARRSTVGIAAIWIGFGFVVTGLVVGGTLAGQGTGVGMPFDQAMGAIAVGELLLFALTILLGIPAMRTGLNLSLLSKYSYGSKGFALPMAVMGLLTLGWFASILGMIGDIWGGWLGNPTGVTVIDPAWFGKTGAPVTLEVLASCLVFGALFTWTAYRGIAAIERVALPVAPFVLVVAVWVGGAIIAESGGFGAMVDKSHAVSGLGFGAGITTVVGAWIAGAIMGVDIFRFAKHLRAVLIGGAACFILTNPVLNVIGYAASVASGDFNFVNWMYRSGVFLSIIGVLVWTTSLWTTNNSELYCNALYTGPVLDAFGVKAKRTKLILIAGVVGTILGSAAFYQLFFADFINILGAAFVPLAGPIIVDFYFTRRGQYGASPHAQAPVRWPGVISFAAGAALGLVFQYGVALPGGFPAGIAALLITMALHATLHYALRATRTAN
ncbi:MAG: cytosine permease [Bifidobacteriaceae bacterium]|jgi:cytosine permease|nr:cytosine permease [Bifidobacteriaceae bacterium]